MLREHEEAVFLEFTSDNKVYSFARSQAPAWEHTVGEAPPHAQRGRASVAWHSQAGAWE